MNYLKLPIKFNITNCNDMLHGSQDHSIGLLNNFIILIGGFCTSLDGCQTPKMYRNKINPCTNYKRGFINEIFCYSIENNSWKTIGKIPIHPRQCCGSIVLGNKMYVWGGFSYTPLTEQELQEYKNNKIPLPSKRDIYSYADGCCLSYDNNTITWNDCPNLPFPLVGFGLVNYTKKNKLYFLNGCIYDRKSFNTFHIIKDIPIGQIFFSLSYDENYNIIPNSIEYINNFPGSPRMSANTHIIDDFIYVLGGINTTSETNKYKGYTEYTYNNVVDNWRYNINENRWESLPGISIPICNQGSVLYENRYIILMGGIKYNTTYVNDKIIETKVLDQNYRLPYNNISTIKNQFITQENTANQYNWYFSNIIVIYDTLNNEYKISDTVLPLNINIPKVILYSKYIYIMGGEGNPGLINNIYYGNCISLALKICIDVTY